MSKLGILLVVGNLGLMVACGGGSSGGGGNTPTITSVTAACSPSTIQSGQTSQCSASVTGTGSFSSSVTWSASAGSISSSGLLTAPTVSSTTSVTITATSAQDTSKSGMTTVTVNPPGTITSVTVMCSPSTIQSGQTSQCSASVSGTGSFSLAVTWSAGAGQISSSGLLTAPIVSGNTPVTVTATSTQDTTMSGTATDTVTPTAAANNVAPLIVDAGPDPQNAFDVNVPFVTIKICVPGTQTCQTIDHVAVDTGSSGLRIVASNVLTIPLPPQTDSSGNPLDECLVFEDGYVWGPVATADITVAGETASNVPVQITIPSSGSPPVPTSCSNQSPPGGNGNEGGSVDAFGANALIGVGLFQHDCGTVCTTSPPPDAYYDCPSSGCTPTTVTLAQQVANPVSKFAADNNGVLIQFPSVPDGGLLTANGFLIFGIGTQSNNALGSSMVYPVPDSGNNMGNFTTLFNGASYPSSFIDSGSNGFFFPDANIALCSRPDNHWYCPTSPPDNLTAVNQGSNGQGGPTTHFSIENASMLFGNNNGNNTAFSTLGGPNGSGASSSFDWGLSFFFGRDVFTAIENMSTPGGNGPYFAYNLP